MKPRVYVDTSVFSSLFDERMPERRAATVDFWERRSDYELATSELAREELSRVNDPERRSALLALLKEMDVLAVTGEMRDVAAAYVDKGCFSPAMFNDALHVAAAVCSRRDILLSWNFRHLVNRLQRIRVNAASAELGLPPLEILAPPEA